jgi:hypothetical protein
MFAGAGLLALFLLRKYKQKDKTNESSNVTTSILNTEFNIDSHHSSMPSLTKLWNSDTIDPRSTVSNTSVATDVPKPSYPVHPTLHVKDQCRAVAMVPVPPVLATIPSPSLSLTVSSQGGDGKTIIPMAVAIGVNSTIHETTTTARSSLPSGGGGNPTTPTDRMLSEA